MANSINYLSQIVNGQVIQDVHLNQFVYALTGSQAYDLKTSGSYTIIGPLYATASWATNALNANTASRAVLATNALNAPDYVPNLVSGSFAITGSNTFKADQIISGSLVVREGLEIIGGVTASNVGSNLATYQEVLYVPFPGGGAPTIVVSKPAGAPVSMFIDYQVVNIATFADQRTGTILANFNSSGTPTSTFTELLTGDIGNTSDISFTTNVGATYDIRVSNAGAAPYVFKAILRYY